MTKRRTRSIAAQCKANTLAVARVQSDAAVALDAFILGRDVDELFGRGHLSNLLRLAMRGHRLAHPTSRAILPFKRAMRGKPGDWEPTFDVYCQFCGELLALNMSGVELSTIRKGPPQAALVGVGDIATVITKHTTVCALQCLAGMREYAAPSVRKLPEVPW